MEDDDIVSEVSCGSVISLQSLDDQYQEKPKRGKRTKTRDQSPYLTQPLGGVKSSQNRNTGHEAWSKAIRNGFTGISTENSSNNWMTSPLVKKKSKIRHSASQGPFSRDEHLLASGKPAYKSQEDYYDEVNELRQVIKSLKTDNGLLKTKLQRITHENILKDRQIKDFLNPNKQPEEIRRTLTDKNADSSSVVSSLKQKLHLMERNVKDKENELRKLKSDLKTTNVDEIRIQMETYYEENQRLQTVLSSLYSHVPGTRNISDARSSSRVNTPRHEGLGRVNGDYFEQILEEKRRLESENQSLKKDLLCAINEQHKTTSENVDYADMNRVQMLKKIKELEQSLEDVKIKQKNGSKEFKKPSSDKDKNDELQKKRELIETLKKDKAYYREEVDKLRSKLNSAEDEIDELTRKLRRVNEEQKRREKEDEISKSSPRPTPRQRNKNSSIKKKISFHGVDEKKDDLISRREDEAARILQRNWRKHQKNTLDNEDNSLAVLQIQSAFRAHAVRRQRVQLLSEDQGDAQDDIEWDDAVTKVQAAMRAHHARRKYHHNSEKFSNDQLGIADDSDDEKQGKKQTLKQQSFLKKLAKPESTQPRMVDSNDDDDDDDDVVIGGSRMNLKNIPFDEAPDRKRRPFNNKQSTNGENNLQKSDSEDSEDNVQVSTRFGKAVLKNNTTANEGHGFVFGDSVKTKEVDEKRLRNFFGNKNTETDLSKNVSDIKESSLDNFFTRSTKAERFDSDPESEAGKKNDAMVEEKPKKSLFSWGSSKRNSSKHAPVPAPRKKFISGAESTNVWSSRPSELSDDDDDVVVTPKFSRKTPTKTASLLDELF